MNAERGAGMEWEARRIPVLLLAGAGSALFQAVLAARLRVRF